jgi:uncharacterized protein (TIGR04141 family)
MDHGNDTDEPGDADATKVVSLYKINYSGSFDDCWCVTDEQEVDNYASLPVNSVGDEALLVFGFTAPKSPDWVIMVDRLTGLDLDYQRSEASAVLFVKVDDNAYALTFGGGWRLLKSGRVDRDFGLNFALRALDSDEVKRIKKHSFTQSRIDYSVVPGGQTLWSYGIREHAELVRQIVGKIQGATHVNISHTRRVARRRNVRISIDCTDRIRVPLPYSSTRLKLDLREISRVLARHDVDPALASLQWIRRLSADESVYIDEAWDNLLSMLENFEDDVTLAYPGRYHEGPEVARYQILIGSESCVTEELTLDHIRQGIAGRDIESKKLALKNGRIDGYDDDGNTIGGSESARKWLSGQVQLEDGRRLVLLEGDWYDLTDIYRRHVDRIVNEVFERRPGWDLPAWRGAPTRSDGGYEEKLYNKYVESTGAGFLCLDRKLLYTRTHPKGFECCDLLGPNQELIHVKKVSSKTGSGPLSHLFAQGIVAVDSLTDPGTWADFVKKVRTIDHGRAEKLGSRPQALVYAIHRSNGKLTPDKLFTFARSELASASILFGKFGVNLQMCVIP